MVVELDHILSLYSDRDTVQVGLADKVTGIPGPRLSDWLPQNGQRWDTDSEAERLNQNFHVPTTASGTKAHAVHGAIVGALIGRWLNSGASFTQIVQAIPGGMPVVRATDTGE